VKDGQVEAILYPGAGEASLYARMTTDSTQYLLLQRLGDGSITLYIQSGNTIRLAPPVTLPVVDGERYKLRFIGSQITVLRVVDGEELILFDLIEKRLMNEVRQGVRLDGGGSADNFRVLAREAI